MRERGRPCRVAFHEAGHAVAAWAHGVTITYATIIPNGKINGQVLYGSGLAVALRPVLAFAGPAAQRRSHPRSNVDGEAASDHESIEMTTDVLFAALHDRTSFIRRADREARELVDRHWLAVDRVARALKISKALSGFAIVPIIELAEEEWAAAAKARPGLTPFAYARERAILAQGPPPLRRAHIEAAALRLGLAGQPVTEPAVIADLTIRGFDEAAIRTLWNRING